MINVAEHKQGDIRLGLVQWMVRPYASVQEFLQKLEHQILSFANYGADFVLYPEYFSLPLMTLFPHPTEIERLKALATLSDVLRNEFLRLATRFGVNIIAGSVPEVYNGHLRNATYLCRRDGSSEVYYKIHLTPSEKRSWDMRPGDLLGIYDTDCGRIGIQTCYDVEFPELGRLYAEAGAKMIFVPFSTDSQEGYYRVRHCAQARAIENECYVAIAGCVGYLPEVTAVEFQYGSSAVMTPSDYNFPSGAVKSSVPPNVEAIIVTDVNLSLLQELHAGGSVRNLQDRRKDLYTLTHLVATLVGE